MKRSKILNFVFPKISLPISVSDLILNCEKRFKINESINSRNYKIQKQLKVLEIKYLASSCFDIIIMPYLMNIKGRIDLNKNSSQTNCEISMSETFKYLVGFMYFLLIILILIALISDPTYVWVPGLIFIIIFLFIKFFSNLLINYIGKMFNEDLDDILFKCVEYIEKKELK